MLKNWGCPHHGTISGGMLTLPNGGVIECQDPVYYPGDYAGYGNTLIQRMPWAPGAVRTTEQAEADDLAGWQWLDYALLSGLWQNLHGVTIRGWIYASPDGKPWLIETRQLGNYLGQSSWSRSFLMRRFGRVHGPASSRGFVLSLDDTGQGSPSLTGTVFADLADITPDGSKAIVALHLKTPTSGGYVKLDRHPVGFWLIELSGTPGVDFVATMSVLKTRTQAIGSISDTGPIPATQTSYELRGTVETTSPGEGYSETTTVWGAASSANYNQYNGARTWQLTGKVVAMWFDSEGVPQPVTVSITQDWSAAIGAISTSYEGTLTATTPEGGVTSYSGELTSSLTRNGMTRSMSRTVTATFMGESISASATQNETLSYSYTSSRSGPGVSEQESSGGTASLSSSAGDYSAQIGGGLTQSAGDYSIGITPQVAATALTTSDWLSAGDNYAQVGLWQYSNNLISSITQTGAPGSQDNMTWRNGSSLTPGGRVSGVDSAPATYRHGSWNPGTGEVVRGKADPICWT